VLLNDPIGGTIGVAHYNQWRDHFGQTPAGSGSGSLAAVPEPASALLLAVMAMLLPLARVQRR
jgi:hypothetical protein